ncbi:Protein of unknown function [Pyronema omphalodes CBS 100304]|uniref:Uncharacterized protein n=1 Tax=Pyronema omphalodes (strain CBS 100304) TaxID=1076935 RepID=U4L4K2_PYROM|nr:Protein of unknown function [Pyronema omphalodes CBS 100304]
MNGRRVGHAKGFRAERKKHGHRVIEHVYSGDRSSHELHRTLLHRDRYRVL